MKKSTRAVLLSALGAPGIGEIHLGRPARGLAILGLFLVLCAVLIGAWALQVYSVLGAFGRSGEEPDPMRIWTDLGLAFAPYARLYVAGLGGVILLWLISVFETYRLGRKGE